MTHIDAKHRTESGRSTEHRSLALVAPIRRPSRPGTNWKFYNAADVRLIRVSKPMLTVPKWISEEEGEPNRFGRIGTSQDIGRLLEHPVCESSVLRCENVSGRLAVCNAVLTDSATIREPDGSREIAAMNELCTSATAGLLMQAGKSDRHLITEDGMKKIKQAFVWMKIRALEATIDGQSVCLDLVRDPFVKNQIIMAQINARNELRKLRIAYRELRSLSAADSWRIAL